LDANTAQRFARHIQLSAVGPEGQERFAAARVVVAGRDLAADIAVTYLRAAGVGALTELRELPKDGAEWLTALDGADVVVRSGFDDDAMMPAAKRLGVAVVAMRARAEVIDVVAQPRRTPEPDAPLGAPAEAAMPPQPGANAVVAGALAAAEVLHTLLRSDTGDRRARHLRLPFDGGDPVAQRIGAR